MAVVVKVFKTLRNNWKKSIVGMAVLGYGAKFANQKYEESLIRTEYCKIAKKYGDTPLTFDNRIRKVTVFLNPTAQGGKGRKLFEKNVAPILYLAGLEVNVIKTEYEGQAKKYMDVIEDTDAIVVAGGDGTVMETITGLLRRSDEKLLDKVPIGIIPLGRTNTVAKLLFDKGTSDVRWLAETTMAVVKGMTKPIDIMCLKGEKGKPVFALSGLQWGSYCEAEKRAKKYWYLGPLKHRWTYISTTIREWPPLLKATLSYVLPCEGCSKCCEPPPARRWRWWNLFMTTKVEAPRKDYSKIENEDCGKEYSKDVETLEFTVKCSNHHMNEPVEKRALDIATVPASISKQEFIKEGWRRSKNPEEKSEDPTLEHISVSKFKLNPKLSKEEEWFTIDSEQFEAMSVEVTLLKEKIKVFCNPSKTNA